LPLGRLELDSAPVAVAWHSSVTPLSKWKNCHWTM